MCRGFRLCTARRAQVPRTLGTKCGETCANEICELNDGAMLDIA